MLVGCDHRESFTGSEEPPGIVPVGMYGVGGNHRDWEYHGGGGGCDRRRTRCCVLDVGVGISRDGDGLRGDGPRHPLSGKRPERRLDGGTDDLSGKAAGMSRGGGPLRIFLHPGSVRDGQYGTGERDLGDSVLCVRDPGGCSGGDPCDPCGHRAGRRRTADLSRGGAACSIVCGALYGSSAGSDHSVCRECTGSDPGNSGGCIFLPQRCWRSRGLRDLPMRQLWDRQRCLFQ